ncbi:MAG: DUF4386 domain-containing protein [Acidobacteriota bacterium]|nr:DUF4386 domain-containing protein [Acidobacteriota bacterium]MDQ3919008.1 DUF4386 domain-containing protein [Acidobacteriota bacterium]
MTLRTNARVAGFTLLFYIASGVASLSLFGRAAGGEGVAEKLGAIARHATDVRLTVLLVLSQGLSALVLAVTLRALTREVDRDLALLGFACRLVEGVTGVFVARSLGLLWLATAGSEAADAGAARVLGAFLLRMGAWNAGATFFAVGSAVFSWLFLRGRLIPAALAWLGVIASVLLVAILPLQLAGLLGGPLTQYVWLPMLVFEVALALWLIVRGVAVAKSEQPG